MKNIAQDLFLISEQMDYTRLILLSKIDEVEDAIKVLNISQEVTKRVLNVLLEVRQIMEDPALEEDPEWLESDMA